jgi:hypothetical protein
MWKTPTVCIDKMSMAVEAILILKKLTMLASHFRKENGSINCNTSLKLQKAPKE